MCAYFAVIPPAQGINCFRKIVEDGEVHNNEGEVNCLGEDDDKCGTLTFTVDSSVDVMIKNCTRSAIDCNEEEVCERITAHVENLGRTLTQCSLSCCDTDMCNAPGKVQEEGEKENNVR